MNEPHYEQFEYAKTRLKLSTTEKGSQRAQLLAHMRATTPAPKPVRSPYSWMLQYGMRAAFAFVLVIAVSGAGVAWAAERSLPGETLYAVKVNISEPVQVALTFNPKDRADLEVQLVDEHLQDLSLAAAQGTLDPAATAFATDELNQRIDAAQADISALHQSTGASTELGVATDLGATLQAHSDILEKMKQANPSLANVIDPVADAVDASLTDTQSLIATTTAAVDSAGQAGLGGAVDTQQQDTAQSLTDLKGSVDDALASLSAEDKGTVSDSIARIQALVAAAQDKDTAGDEKAAFALYLQASEQITILKTTVDASQDLQGIDVIGTSTEVDASATEDQP